MANPQGQTINLNYLGPSFKKQKNISRIYYISDGPKPSHRVNVVLILIFLPFIPQTQINPFGFSELTENSSGLVPLCTGEKALELNRQPLVVRKGIFYVVFFLHTFR